MWKLAPTNGSLSSSDRTRAPRPGCRIQVVKRDRRAGDASEDQPAAARDMKSDSATIMRVDSGSSAVEAAVEVRERRHHLDHDDADQHDRQRDQDHRIDHRRDGLGPDRVDGLGVGHKAPQHGVEVAGALARHQRRGVDAGKQIAVRRKRVGQRRAAAHLFVHIIQHRFEHRVGHARAQDVERLHERHAGLEQRGQLLVEHQELVARDLAALTEGKAAEAEPRPQRKDVQSFVLELPAKGGFALGDVNALDDLARRGAESAAEFHPKRLIHRELYDFRVAFPAPVRRP